MIGLLGVVLSVFVGIYSSYWTSPASVLLEQGRPAAITVALFFTAASLVGIVVAIVLGVVMILPRTFVMGIELEKALELVSRTVYSLESVKEGALRTYITNLSKDLIAYGRSIVLFNLASVIGIVSLVFSVQFLMTIVIAERIAESQLMAFVFLMTILAEGAIVVGALSLLFIFLNHMSFVRGETERVGRLSALK